MNNMEKMRAKESLLQFDDVNKLLRYDHSTGKLFWRVNRHNRVFPGDEAGYYNKYGYIIVKINNYYYPAHRIIWLLVTGKWPINIIDHKDRNGYNNKLDNLRQAPTFGLNSANCNIRIDNTSGVKGVTWNKRVQKWRARITINGKIKFLGAFITFEGAVRTRLAAEKKYYNAFANNPEGAKYLETLSM
jgi:HNH endonuclease